jgi:hypothetical protein
VQELENVMELPSRDDSTYEEKVELLLWYVDELLPYAVGLDQYNEKERHHKTMVSTVDIDGNPKPRVSAKSEAMLLVIYKNCYKKWKLIMPKMINNPGWRMPRYNKNNQETHKYHDTLWSDNKSGKVAMGGWRSDAIRYFNTQTERIVQFRLTDNKNKWKMMKFCLQIMRKAHNFKETTSTGKRKRDSSLEGKKMLTMAWNVAKSGAKFTLSNVSSFYNSPTRSVCRNCGC